MMPTVGAPRQILLIDDHGPCRQVLAHLLRAAGHLVAEADGGSAGLARLRQVPPDLVVTDRDMPGLTGCDVARLLKATHPHLPVVLMTGGVDANTAGYPARTYVDAILGKPFPVAELLAVIARLTDGASAPVKPTGARNTYPAGRCPTGSQRGGAIWRAS